MRSRYTGYGVTIALLLASTAGATVFTQEILQRAYAHWAPSLCILKFTQEVADPRTGELQQQNGNALALVVSPEGLLLSNGHLQRENITTANFRAVMQRDDREVEYKATLLEKPKDINVAFLKIAAEEPLNLPFVRFTRGSSLEIGQEVAVLGLMGETMDFHHSLIVARISAIIEEPRTAYCLDNALRLGYITGPVINAHGEVVGVTGFELSVGEGGDLYTRSGHPMVFQSDLFSHYIDRPPENRTETEETEEAWLGVLTQPLAEDYAEYWGLDSVGGLIISTVLPDSPAAAAGLFSGDIIRSFDGQPIRAVLDRDVLLFTQMVREKKINQTVEIVIWRDGETKTLSVHLGARPRSAQDAGEYTDETLGLVVREITRDLRILLNLGEDVQGVIVRRVISGSPAQIARMQPGVIVLSVADMPVAGLEDFKKSMDVLLDAKPEEISIFARAGTVTGFFRVRPRW